MKYSIFQMVKLGFDLLRTKLFYNEARIIRFPFDIRGRKYIKIGIGTTTGIGCRLEAYPIEGKSVVLRFGRNIQINDYVHITAMENVTLGNNVLIASKVYISDSSHGSYNGDGHDSHPDSVPIDRPYTTKPVIIEDNVWIGELVSILPGVTIGKGTIVGANAVVSKSLPPYVIAVGIPAKPIKKFNFETNHWDLIEK
jgi:acetyltransferase-like isoleucine patch superfamily enzyme